MSPPDQYDQAYAHFNIDQDRDYATMSSLTDLFEFLHSPNPDARHLALQNLIGQTPKGSPSRNIFVPSLGCPVWEKVFPDEASQTSGTSTAAPVKPSSTTKRPSPEDIQKLTLLQDLKTLCRDQAHIAHDAFSALVNLADSISVARHLVDKKFLVFLVAYTANHTSPLSPLSAMLLSNLTSHPTLTSLLPTLPIPIIRFPLPLPSPFSSYPSFYYPSSVSASSTIHPLHRPEMETGPEAKEETVEAVRVLVQAFEEGAARGVDRPEELVEGQVDGNGDGDSKEGAEVKRGKAIRKGGVHFLGSVFANIGMLPQTRPTLLIPYPSFPLQSTPQNISEEDEPLLTKICVYTEHREVIRRGGALGCIKNAAMDRASHPFLLATEDDRVPLPDDPKRLVKGVDVLPFVLSPLLGPEEVDLEEAEELPLALQMLGPEKQRERDPVLRLMCVEILLLLATSFTGREALRRRGTYVVIKMAHDAEQDAQIMEHMIRLVGLLKRDEGDDSLRDKLQPQGFGSQPELSAAPEDDGDSDLEIEVI